MAGQTGTTFYEKDVKIVEQNLGGGNNMMMGSPTRLV
jgi:hypothetical protein